MKNYCFIFLIISLFACSNQENTDQQNKTNTAVEQPSFAEGAYRLVSAESSLRWKGKKVGDEHFGKLNLSAGSLNIDLNSDIMGGNFAIDMNSLLVEEPSNKEDNAKLLEHLKSDDFFSVAKYPSVSFVIIKSEPYTGADATHQITGDLTIKGITHQITFPAMLIRESDRIMANAQFEIDRTKWHINFKSKSIFPHIADKFIDDMIGIELNLTLKK